MQEREREIAGALEGLVAPGDRFVVRWTENGIVVRKDEDGAPLRRDDPELYGFLAAANERISSATGCGLMAVFAALVIGGCLALDRFLPDFAVWYVYAGLGIAALVAWNMVDDVFEARAYEREKRELADLCGRRGLGRNTLVGTIAGDRGFSRLLDHLKKDPDPGF